MQQRSKSIWFLLVGGGWGSVSSTKAHSKCFYLLSEVCTAAFEVCYACVRVRLHQVQVNDIHAHIYTCIHKHTKYVYICIYTHISLFIYERHTCIRTYRCTHTDMYIYIERARERDAYSHARIWRKAMAREREPDKGTELPGCVRLAVPRSRPATQRKPKTSAAPA